MKSKVLFKYQKKNLIISLDYIILKIHLYLQIHYKQNIQKYI